MRPPRQFAFIGFALLICFFLATGVKALADAHGPVVGVIALVAIVLGASACFTSPVLGATARSLRIDDFIANIAMPNANATTFSAFFDLGQTTAHSINERISLVANIPAIANLANTKVITITVDDADANANANAAALSLVGSKVITGGASGAAAVEAAFALPGTCRRFVRLKAVGGADAGTTITEIATAEVRI